MKENLLRKRREKKNHFRKRREKKTVSVNAVKKIVHQNAVKKKTISRNAVKIVCGASTCRALEYVLSESKNHLVQSKSRYKLLCATESSPGHQRVEVHQNSPQKRTQLVETPPGTVKFMRKLQPGHQGSAEHRNSPQKRTQRVEKLPGTVETALQTMIGDEIVSCA